MKNTKSTSFLLSGLCHVGFASLLILGCLKGLARSGLTGPSATLAWVGSAGLFFCSLVFRPGSCHPLESDERHRFGPKIAHVAARASLSCGFICLVLCSLLPSPFPLSDPRWAMGILLFAGAWFAVQAVWTLLSPVCRSSPRKKTPLGVSLDDTLWQALSVADPPGRLLCAERVRQTPDCEFSSSLIRGLTLLSSARPPQPWEDAHPSIQAALRCFLHAASLDDKDPLSRRMAGLCHCLMDDPDQALIWLTQAQHLGEAQEGHLALELAIARMKKEQWAEAKEGLSKARQLDPALALVVRTSWRRLLRESEPQNPDGRPFNFFDLLARLDIDEPPGPSYEPGSRLMDIEGLLDEIADILTGAGVTDEQSLRSLLDDGNSNRALLTASAKMVLGCLAVLSQPQSSEAPRR